MSVEAALFDLGVGLSVVTFERATDVGRDQIGALLRQEKYSRRIDDLGTEFSDALREAIAEVDDERDTGELGDVADNWQAVVDELETQDAFERDDDGIFFSRTNPMRSTGSRRPSRRRAGTNWTARRCWRATSGAR